MKKWRVRRSRAIHKRLPARWLVIHPDGWLFEAYVTYDDAINDAQREARK